MMEITSDTRIIDLTVGQLMDLFAKAQAPATQAQPKEEKRLVYGSPESHKYSIAA